ncbi:putative ABC multidrug transporter [Seiridium cardinale]
MERLEHASLLLSGTTPPDETIVGQYGLEPLTLAVQAAISGMVLSLSSIVLLINQLRSRSKGRFPTNDAPVSGQSRPGLISELCWIVGHLCALTAAVLDGTGKSSNNWGEFVVIVYVLTLSAVGLLSPPGSRRRSQLSSHAVCVTIAEALLTACQLATFTLFTNGRIERTPLWLLGKFAAFVVALVVCFVSPCTWIKPSIALGLAQRDDPTPSPEQTCSYFSYFMSYSWIWPVIKQGSMRRLSLADLPPLPDYEEPLIWRERILEARKRYKSTLPTLIYTLRESLGRMVCFAAITAVVEFLAPYAIFNLLRYLQNPTAAEIRPWIWVTLMFVGPVLRSASYQQYIFNSTRLIVRTKLCLIQELYAKAGLTYEHDDPRGNIEKQDNKTETNDRKDKKTGTITNLIAFDVDAICNSRDFVLVCVATPIEITIGTSFLYLLFGPCALIALCMMLCSFPVATILSRRLSHLQRQVMKHTDDRVSLISEYISSIRTIKYLAWEKTVQGNINAARQLEETQTWRRNLFGVVVVVLSDFIPLFALFIMFAFYTLVMGQKLTAAKAFTAISVIETLRLQFVWVANVTRFMAQAQVAFGRIDRYITNKSEIMRPPEGPPGFKNATFRRTPSEESFRLSVDGFYVTGALNVVSGPSGSGKSTLLLSLLGETVLESGGVFCPRDVAYASQTPWLLNDTIRTNIVAHEPFDRERYEQVLKACALNADLEKIENGDLAEVGTDGSNLSGGQRQRICLARAIYSSSQTLLLDDVFSALDSTTQEHIWDFCFSGDLVTGRTIILVTQMAAAKDAAALVTEMSQGRVVSQNKGRRVPRPRTNPPLSVRHSSLCGTMLDLDVSKKSEQVVERKINQETTGQSRNPRTLFYQYMLHFGSHRHAMLAVFLVLLTQLALLGIPLWVSVWVGAYDRENALDVAFYIAIYATTLVSFSLFSAMSQSYFQHSAWKVAQLSHRKLTSAVLSVSLHWYGRNSPGRVINRFSRDMFSLDSILVDYLRITIDNGIRFIFRLAIIGSIMPIFGVPAALLCGVCLVCAEMYTRTQLSVKALSSAAQSPIFSFFAESMAGRPIIRARVGMGSAFSQILARRMRLYARAAMTQYNLNRWICVRADACAALIAFATGVIALSFQSKLPAGLVGFSLTNATGLGQTILNLVRNMNELEVELNCFHRVMEYATLPPEEEETETNDGDEEGDSPLSSWPSEGRVQFCDVTANYEAGAAAILRNLSFTVHAGEKVAIIGRTGSGKSTIALSLLRFTNIVSGKILIDGVDITQLPRRMVRERLTIIPQEPVLLSGDIRSNLDPSYTSNRRQLARAIETCSLLNSQVGTSVLADATSPVHFDSLTLESHVAPRGSNFSQGQRQVLSLARATIRNSSVVVLDEATASVDHKSDELIQSLMKTEFDKKTVIAIVHRLSSILEYDRIVVIDNGVIRETGTPQNLYNQNGAFTDMIRQSIKQGRGGEWTPEKLRKLNSFQL